MSDEFFMRRSLELAGKGGKATLSNPNVGCIIVCNGVIIGEGYHKKYGGPHAEVEAVMSVKDHTLLKDSVMYVTLEPCCHTDKKTPPCTSLIIEKGIKKVVIGTLDPNPQVAGNGVKILREHNIEVVTGVLEKEALHHIRKFKTNLQQLPYIILKIVQSEDGYTGMRGKQVWLSNEYTNLLTHRWRSEVDAIMTGKHTIFTDDPSLTTRHWHGDDPVRIIWDNKLQIPDTAKIFGDTSSVIVLNTLKSVLKNNIEYLNTSNLSLREILHLLYQKGITSIIVEGGSKTHESFINQNLWDEARVITTPQRLLDKSGEFIKAAQINESVAHHLFIKADKVETFYNSGK